MPAIHPSALLASLCRALDAADAGDGPSRTLLVVPARGAGRELLRALARERGRWLGVEVTTVRPLALAMVGATLSEEGRGLADDFAQQALVEEALDEAMEGGDGRFLGSLAEGPGFRKAVREAVSALRLASVPASRLARSPLDDAAKRDALAAVLDGFERRLERRKVADTAVVLRRAAEALAAGAPLPADRVLLAPGLGMRGLSGAFVRALQARGAVVLEADRVEGLPPPAGLLWRQTEQAPPLGRLHAPAGGDVSAAPLALFHAGGVTEELREVLRRVLASGRRWDEVEIVTPDPGVYGPALHALGARLGVPVTFAVGLPVERTRPGRVVAAWLRWLDTGFPAAVLRRLLEAGDLAAPPPFGDVRHGRLAHRLRRLQVGWGRGRYLPALGAALARRDETLRAVRGEEGADDSDDDRTRALARGRREMEALEALLRPILEAAPEVGRRGDAAAPKVSAADLARGLEATLRRVPVRPGSVDETARDRLLDRVDRVRATLVRPTTFMAAAASLDEHLAIRVPAPRAEGRAPWGSAGGHLHLSDVEHGGLSGRAATFVVGLDSGRFPGAGLQDPLLLDAERRALASEALPTSGERLEETRFRMAALLARLRGEVTLSYSAWDASEGRGLTPSPVVLQAFRLLAGNPAAGYEELRDHLGDPLSRIPPGPVSLDGEDVWLSALHRDGRLLEGVDAVRAGFPGLDRGVGAREALEGAAATAHHGLVAADPSLDPRRQPDAVLSATRLEALGTCPLRYFYQYVLHVKAPEDPELDPDRWLSPLDKGSLLHGVYERALREARAEGLAYEDEGFGPLAFRVLGEELEAAAERIPVPSEAVRRREVEALEDDVKAFVRMVREQAPEWTALERPFGFDGVPAAEVAVPGGTLRLRGRIDRLDAVEGGLRVVDYKTGSTHGWDARTGVYRGGRRLQHVVYALAAEALEGTPVTAVEYHFPTRKGENLVARYTRADLRDGEALLAHMMDAAALGRFLATDTSNECKFCDYRDVCRVSETRFKLVSPRSDWTKARMDEPTPADDALAHLRRARGWEEDR